MVQEFSDKIFGIALQEMVYSIFKRTIKIIYQDIQSKDNLEIPFADLAHRKISRE